MDFLALILFFFKKIQEFKPAYPPTSLPPPTYTHKINFSVHPEKSSYISGKRKPEKTCIFSKESCSYTLENRNFQKLFIFQETEPPKTSYIPGSDFPSSKIKKHTLKKFLLFQEMELSYISGNGTFLIFQEVTCKA